MALGNENKSVRLTGTAILAALVIIFDYTLKYSGLKIPFPWYPNLKFDFTGIPIALSLFLYGFPSSVTTSLVAGVGIVARSGNLISASLKVAAELSTVIGLHLGDKVSKSRYVKWGSGLLSRVLLMSIVNLYVLPNVYRVPMEATIGLLPVIGYFLFEAVQSRLPRWAP